MLIGKPKLGIIAAALLLANTPVFPANPARLAGSIAGIVRDTTGIPQMGATVLLFDKYEKLLQRALTNERGAFGFETLIPDLYSVRVSLASFMPAMRQKIAVQPGLQSLLYINLANLLSSIDLVYAPPGQGALMSDDWKWTLKTANATRPILRFRPEDVGISRTPDPRRSLSAIFSDTRGLVTLSGGDAGTLGASTDQQDLGTAFALATSLFGRNQLQVSGNVGYTLHSGVPTAGFRTTYRRDGMGPEISVTMRQINLPTRAGMALTTGQDGMPALRSTSIGMMDRTAITEKLLMEYGVSLDSVSFVDHLNYFSPFARLTYDLGKMGTVQFAYSSGGAPAGLARHAGASTPEVPSGGAGLPENAGVGLSENLAALSLSPRVSMLDAKIKVQRTQNFELGYEKIAGSRTFDVSVYREIVSNGALTVAASDDLFVPGDVLPDISSNSSIINIGRYERYGYAASVTQSLGDNLEVGGSAGRTGVLTADDREIAASADDVRSRIRMGQRFWGSARASATLPHSATKIISTYEWTDYSALMPTHYYLTQRAYPEPGLNIHIRQPIPSFAGLPGRLEATVDLRNMLAQGYLHLTADGRQVLLMQNPRALRGGLSFVF
jgi:Carboxypeptidase regulatory-like domain/TonB dependent receptor